MRNETFSGRATLPARSLTGRIGSSLLLASMAAIAGCQCQNSSPPAAMVVPGTSYTVSRNWGTLPPVTVHNARNWPMMQASYLSGNVRHNPVYLKDIDHNAEYSGSALTPCSVAERELTGIADIPWFYINLAISPIMMLQRPPLSSEVSSSSNIPPIYNGRLSPVAADAVVPAGPSAHLTGSLSVSSDGKLENRTGK